jgi:predicted Rossmann-fold nucleotide-binding protein
MEAASRGAAEAGGVVVGLLPGFQRDEANRWVTIPIVTGMDQARNVILVRSCDAIIAVGGMYGTLSEIALALKFGTPVVGLGTWRVRQPDDRRVPILVAATADDAVARALRAARRRHGAGRRRRRQRAVGRGQRAAGRGRPAALRGQPATRRGGRAVRSWLG